MLSDFIHGTAFNSDSNSWVRNGYPPHFTDKESAAQRSDLAKVTQLGLECKCGLSLGLFRNNYRPSIRSYIDSFLSFMKLGLEGSSSGWSSSAGIFLSPACGFFPSSPKNPHSLASASFGIVFYPWRNPRENRGLCKLLFQVWQGSGVAELRPWMDRARWEYFWIIKKDN